jgi:hypothetical protein
MSTNQSRGEWHPWSTWCILKGTSRKRNTRGEWHPWSMWCVLKGTSRKKNDGVKGTNLDGPKSNISLRNFKTTSVIKMSPSAESKS